ncbi:hypothetical protein COU17_00125 [Candidatus Kaiserbacteria bacterium CG10_big_fil_rev_8_21_14_0_10_49_17]|uniref:DUF378 domain-containing protein n=1 Tax=Candidatus Kaiserbacteria bacterium CG10_big_fil_rev_8_21_14_0_10_49_17 TaxID=1974609 RepID=A0A2M6WF69_9BACT|nr:MAG: hypothetical protein COU17_00125 [Candidatus Kaiserbacteria bacterium CG10_big_fil_rev_8_21_14_0_10_49_17]
MVVRFVHLKFFCMKKGQYEHLAYWLLIIGGLNWLALALFNWEIGQVVGDGVTMNPDDIVSRVVYGVIGVAAAYMLLMHSRK